MRKQALDWLRANLVLQTNQLEIGKPAACAAVKTTLLHWQKDADLESIGDEAALAKLSAEEQKALTQLWADVAALLKPNRLWLSFGFRSLHLNPTGAKLSPVRTEGLGASIKKAVPS